MHLCTYIPVASLSLSSGRLGHNLVAPEGSSAQLLTRVTVTQYVLGVVKFDCRRNLTATTATFLICGRISCAVCEELAILDSYLQSLVNRTHHLGHVMVIDQRQANLQ